MNGLTRTVDGVFWSELSQQKMAALTINPSQQLLELPKASFRFHEAVLVAVATDVGGNALILDAQSPSKVYKFEQVLS